MQRPTNDELEIVAKFRENLDDLNLTGFLNTDLGLLQWLRARDLNIAKAEEMLRKSLQWRKDNEIDSILSWSPPSELLKLCPIEFTGYDNENSPICYIPFGRWNLRKIFNSGHRSLYLKYLTQLFVLLLHKMEGRVTPTGQPVTQSYIISDVQGFSFRTLACIGAISMQLESCQIFESNFPETLKQCIVINASRVFTAFYALVRPILSQQTFGKIIIYDGRIENWMKILLENIQEHQLPNEIVEIWKTAGSAYNSYTDVTKWLDMEEDDGPVRYKTLSLGAGKKHSIEFEVKSEKSILSWTYMTTHYDIGFCLMLGHKEIVPYRKVDSNLEEQEGSIFCDEKGIYIFIFDNSYSRLREKVLTYRISNLDPYAP